jgi:glycosyltransferase involved in cell wall biosynthesis
MSNNPNNPMPDLANVQLLATSKRTSESEPTIALLHCYDLIDDFLDSINISFDTFCQEFVGSWMFGYIHALKTAGVRTVLFCISARVTEPSRYQHLPSGATICVLPASRTYGTYRAVRDRLLQAYGGHSGQSFKEIPDENAARRSLLTGIKDVIKSAGTYLSTPVDLLAIALKQEGCQSILCQEYEFARFDTCVRLGKRLGLPVFATFQGGNATQSPLEFLPRQRSFRSCSGVIIAPQTEIARVQQAYPIPPAKIARIFNPIDLTVWHRQDRQQARAALGIPDTARMVVWHGRVEIERKGLDLLLDAWARLCEDRPQQDLQLWLIGTGSDAAKLRDRLDTQPLRGVTWVNEFVHDRVQMQQYLSAADLYTMPSRQEGFPVAPIEAMACGLPIVATDAPGIPDILEEGERSGGLMVPRDRVLDLVDALSRVLDQPEWAQTIGCAARLRVERQFAAEVVGQQLRHFLLPNLPSVPSPYPSTDLEEKSMVFCRGVAFGPHLSVNPGDNLL